MITGVKPIYVKPMNWLIVISLILLFSLQLTQSEVLNPPYFNIAEGRKIHATETCGEKGGKGGKEFFCKIIGSMWTDNNNIDHNQGQVVQGQACDYCDPNDPKKAHPAEYAIDGSPKWWQSPPLSRGPEAARVNLTIDLGQEFHVAYVYISMANSPRPGVWVLERSTDNGTSFRPWMYFADSREECIKQFGEESVRPLKYDDQVICETKYSKLIPLENGEMVVSLIEKRPSGDNFTSSEVLQEFTKATNVRLRFIRPQTTFGHLLNVDQTVTRRYFYSIRDINIGGRCVCNGHAETCDVTHQNHPDKLYCACQHNTAGAQCEKCKPGYVQKRWRAATPDNPFECEKCNCNGHSEECEFDEEVEKKSTSMDIHGKYSGGGVCMHCKHHTTGHNCHECKFGFYRAEGRQLDDINVCSKCNCGKTSQTGGCDSGTGTCQCKPNFINAPACDVCAYGYYNEPDCPRCPCYRNGTVGEICDPGSGQCACKDAYSGLDCGSCAPDYWGFPECRRCNCDLSGSDSPNCNRDDGQCSCKKQFSGRQCNFCSIGFYNYPECKSCDCNPLGTTDDICNQRDGKCSCKPGFGGDRCDQCEPGYYGFPNCTLCACDTVGSVNQTCNSDGRCTCAPRFGGPKCNLCGAGYFNFPKCEACMCDPAGSYGVTCQNGVCQCRDNFEGIKCDKCKKNFYNFPICESCSCNPAGVVPNFPGCSEIMSGKLCECKERVIGRYCDTCAPHYKNLRTSNLQGCEPCRCNRAGSLNGLDACDGETGQCACKELVTGTACERCTYGTYALSVGNYLGCVPCDCDLGGSWRGTCDPRTGSCQCRFRIEGRRCDRPQKAHYFYSTYQYLYELEDGRGEYHNVRYDYNETIFPGFSWKGYAKFSDLQKKVIIDFLIVRSSFYRVILHYHNPGSESIIGNLTLSNENEPPQHIKITFPPTVAPKRYLLPMDKTSPLYLFAAQRTWKASLSADDPLLVDYIVFLPQAYFEATLLRENVTAACTISTTNYQLCRHYGYTKFPLTAITYPKDVTSVTGNVDSPQDTRDSFLIDATLLSDQEREHIFELEVDKTQKYVLILSYVYRVTNPPPKGQVAKLTVEVKTVNGTVNNPFQVPMCQYTFPCRHIVLNEKAAPFEFYLSSGMVPVSVKLNNEIGEATFGILGLVFLPKADWHIDHVKPSLVCIMRNLTCLDMSFDSNSESTKIPFGQRGKVSPVSSNSIEGTDVQDRTVELVGTAPRTENYQLIVHYYQPDHPSFDIELTFQRTPTSPSEQATLNIAHCPSKNGCRSVIKFKKPLGVLEENKEFTLAAIPPKDRGVQFDYLLLTAEKSFSPTQLGLPIVDRSTEFLRHCVQDAFYIDDNSSEFCKQALFTLTTGLNNGGAFCSCNATGSKGFTCNPLGGQCDCKPNVIGRECKACRSDYFGFPDCKPCNCPKTAAYCEPVTGECVCPKNVVGGNCDKCAPLTYGYDAKMGCEPCDCHATGVKDGNLQCDLKFGNCDCREKYDGRTCDSCKAGYFEFPICRVCDCHFDGTTADICDRKSGACYCKENVLRPNCDVCRRGTYNLEINNPKGCTKCFCFGTTENCRSSEMKLIPIKSINYSNWSAVDITFTESGERISLLEIAPDSIENAFTIKPISVNRGDIGDTQPGSDGRSNIYFKVPSELLGNRLTSYGGFINYTIVESLGNLNLPPSDTPITPDIILVGRNLSIALTRDEQPEAPGNSQKMEIELLESKFVHLADSTSVSRAQFMTLLFDLQSVYIRAAYFTPVDMVTLTDFSIDSASNKSDATGPLALRVEQCICPPNYKGSSCEECASGYYRVANGPYLGSCSPCQCNGHSNECDPLTGKCFNCKHETIGDHCELCKSGYYGNATVGTPYDCMTCPCPLPNNFAESCEVRPNAAKSTMEIVCNCKPGYTGQNCELCSSGHFGYPLLPGNYCQPCQCNGNIDPTDPGSCELFTGECIKCLNNTAGKSCEYCADDYYGDAIGAKNCQPCQCDPDGTAICDRFTGQCDCHPNVIGDSCDSCKPNHYGFNKGKGCIDCNCANASKGYDCDMETGQCYCQPGATGRTCNECEAGYWKYSSTGCESCGCVEKYSRGAVCNQQTGHCECLPGVVGEKCDKCPWRWVFVDREGCLECGECQHALLNDTDTLDSDILPILNDFSNSSSGIHAKKKFTTLNNRVTELYKLLDGVADSSKAINIIPIESFVSKLTNDSEALSPWQDRLSRLASSVIVKVDETKENATNVRRMIKKLKADLDNLLRTLNDVDYEFSYQIDDPNIESMTRAAEKYHDDIDRIKFEKFVAMVANETDDTVATLDQVKDYISPYIDEKQSLNESRSKLDQIESVLNDANKKIISSITIALDVQRGLNHSREAVKEIIIPRSNSLQNVDSAIIDNLKESKLKLEQSTPNMKAADESFNNLIELSGKIDPRKDEIRGRMFDPEVLQENEFKTLVSNAIEHSYSLNRTASELDSLFLEAIRKANLNRTIKAATAYEVIEKAIESAESSIKESIDKLSAKPWEGLIDRAYSSRSYSTGNRTKADVQRSDIINRGSSSLKTYNDTIKSLEMNMTQQQEQLKKINEGLATIENSSTADTSKDIITLNDETISKTEALASRVAAFGDEIAALIERSRQLDQDELNAHIAIQYGESMTNLHDQKGLNERIKAMSKSMAVIMERVTSSKDKLKQLISHVNKARDLSNRIDVAMKFEPGSFAQLRKPEDLESSGSYNKLSLYFNTSQPDGLLAIVGNMRSVSGDNESGPRNKRTIETTDDYMAILLRSGKVRVVLDLGSGPQALETETRVNDGTWIHLIVERIGKTLKITINKENKEIVTHGHIDGFSSILDLNSKRSKIFIGSIPSDYIVPDTIAVNSFSGSLAHINLGDTPLGLLNFQRGKYFGGESMPNQTLMEGLHFSGRGYATTTIDDSKLTKASAIAVDVRTYARSGLILLLAGPNDYLAIQLDEGRPKAIIDQGSGYVSIQYPEAVNDGNKHTILFDREFKDITFGIRGREIMKSQTSGTQETLELNSTIYIGGYPIKHNLPEVSQTPYEGCLSDLYIDAQLLALGNTTMTPGVMTGCPDSGVREAVFEKETPGFIEMPLSIEIIESVQISFKFRTNVPDGLLFFASNPDQPANSFLAIYILDGTLTLTTHPGRTIKSSGFRYDDNEWHYVMATKNSYQLRLDIDDKTEVDLDTNESVNLNIPSGSFYLGGSPNSFAPVLRNFNIIDRFTGCIGDAVVHDKFQDLKKATKVQGATLITCKIISDGKSISKLNRTEVTAAAATTTTTTLPPTLPTLPPPTSTTTLPPRIQSPCALPLEPDYPEISIATHGRRFFSNEDSRVEVKLNTETISNLFTRASVTLEFRTFPQYKDNAQGIMLILTDVQYVDLFAVYMRNGQLYLSWNLGGGLVTIGSSKANSRYDDADWHSATFSLVSREGTITYPNGDQLTGIAPGNSQSLNIVSPAYVGGLPKSGAERIKSLLFNITNSFPGCIRNVKIGGIPVNLAETDLPTENKFFNAPPCYDAIEEGTFFNGRNSYLGCYDRFRIGSNIEFSFKVRPRNNSGLLAAFFGSPDNKGRISDYLIVKLVDGKVVASVNNGAGVKDSQMSLSTNVTICDGGWHSIKVMKLQNGHFVTINDVSTSSLVFGAGGINVADTVSPMYLGDIPREYRIKFPELPPPYVGCIKDVKYNRPAISDGKQINFVNLVYDCANSGNAVNLCPTV